MLQAQNFIKASQTIAVYEMSFKYVAGANVAVAENIPLAVKAA